MTSKKQGQQPPELGKPIVPVDKVRGARLRMYAGPELQAKIARVTTEALEAAILALPDVAPAARKQLGIRTFQTVKDKADLVGPEAVEAAIMAIPELRLAGKSDAKAKVLAMYPDARVTKYAGVLSLRAGGATLAQAASEDTLWRDAWASIKPKPVRGNTSIPK
jgi:hypothetical protein